METTKKQYHSLAEFYPYYLSQHQDPICRLLHSVGSILAVVVVCVAVFTGQWAWLLLAPVVGYGFSWFGHFMFEKNKPAAFDYPFYSFLCDWLMLKDSIVGSKNQSTTTS